MERFRTRCRVAGLALLLLTVWALADGPVSAQETSPVGASSDKATTTKELLAEAHRLAEEGDMDGAMRLIRRAEALANRPSAKRRESLADRARALTHRLRWPLSLRGKVRRSSPEPDSQEPKPSALPNPFRPSRRPKRLTRRRETSSTGAEQSSALTVARTSTPSGTTVPSRVGTAPVSASPSANTFSARHESPQASLPPWQQRLRARIDVAMADAPPAERQQMFEYLKTVDPSMVDPILKTWRLAHRMGQQPVGDTSTKMASERPRRRPMTEAGSAQQPERQRQASEFGYTGLRAPDPRQAAQTLAGSPSDAWSQSPRAPRPHDGPTSPSIRQVARYPTPPDRRNVTQADATTDVRVARGFRQASQAVNRQLARASESQTEPRQIVHSTNPIQLGFADAGGTETVPSENERLGRADRADATSFTGEPLPEVPAIRVPSAPASDRPSARQAASFRDPRRLNGPSQSGPVQTNSMAAGAIIDRSRTAQAPPPAPPALGASSQATGALPVTESAPQPAPPADARANGSNDSLLAPLPGWNNLRTAIQSAGQELQHSLSEAKIGLPFRRTTRPDEPSAATAPSTESRPMTQEELLQRLIALAEADIANAKPGESDEELLGFIQKHVELRMLYFIAGQQERALEAIPVVEPADQEFWQQMFWAIANYFDREGIPNPGDRATQTVAQLKTAVQRLQEAARLELRNVNFCHKIVSYGNYERFQRDEFTPGQPVLLYAEVENFKSELTSDGQWRTVLKSTIEFYKAGPNGDLVDRIEFPPTEDLCRNHRRDYFHSYELTIPQKISLGPHVLKLIVEDQLSQKVATYTVNFTVK